MMATQEEPPKKRKLDTSKKVQAQTFYADEYDPRAHNIQDPFVLKNGLKMIGIYPKDGKQNSKPYIQFSGGGWISNKFGVETDKWGKTKVTFGVSDQKESANMGKEFKNRSIEIAKKNKDIWWPKGIDEALISAYYTPFISDGAAKKDGDGFWDGNCKAGVKINDDSGDVKDCKILDSEGGEISIYDLPGNKWKVVTVQHSGYYVAAKGWGPMKTMSLIQLASNERGPVNEEVSILPVRKESVKENVTVPKVDQKAPKKRKV